MAIGCAPLLDRVHFGTWWNRGWGKNIQDEFKEFLMVGWLVYTQLWMAYWFLMIYEFLHYYSLQGIWATSYDDLQSAWETFAKMMPMYWFQVLKFFSGFYSFGLIVMTDIPNDGHVGIPAISKYFKPQRSSTKDQQKQGLIKIQKNDLKVPTIHEVFTGFYMFYSMFSNTSSFSNATPHGYVWGSRSSPWIDRNATIVVKQPLCWYITKEIQVYPLTYINGLV